MKTFSPLILFGALGAFSAAGAASAAVDTAQWKCESCPYPKGATGTLDAGIGAVSDASAKFGDFSGLQRSGAHLILGGKLTYRGEGGYFADLSATDLGLDTRSLDARSGREGLYALRLGYSGIPRHFAAGATTPFLGNGGDVLTLPTQPPGALPRFPAGDTATMPLPTTLQPIGLGFNRQRFELGGSLIGGRNWTYRISLKHDVRDGTRPTSASFFSSASQLASPVDQVTDQLEVSASYASRRLQASLAYQLSQFRNAQESLTWQNPFLPVVPGAVRGQLALAPDNQFHQIVGTAGYQVTPSIRASGDFALGRMTQNATYLDPTLNADPAAGLPSRSALPAQSLDGRADTFNGSVRLTATPLDGLRLAASYARDERANQTDIRSYPIVATDIFLNPLPRSNTPFALTQDRFKLSADYRGPGNWKLGAGVEQDKRERSYSEAVTTRETTVWARAGLHVYEKLDLALKLSHAERDHSPYGMAIWFGAPENPLLRKYTLAARKRDSGGARVDWMPTEEVSLGVAVDYANDDYHESLIGLNSARSVSLAADLSVALSEHTQVHAFAQGEQLRSSQTGSQAWGAPDWTGRTRDRFEVLGVGLKHAVIPDKLDIGADLSFARSRSNLEVQTVLGEPPFAAATTSLDSVKLHATYKIDDKLSLTGSYWYEAYDAQDWRLDGVLPATVYNLLAFGAQAPRHHVNVVRVAVRYRF